MPYIFGCDDEEAKAFRRAAEARGEKTAIYARALTPESARRLPYGCAVSVSHRQTVDARTLEALSRRGVRYLSTRSVGLNHIDIEAAERLGIAVEGVGYSPESVAEHVILLMLMALRRVKPMLERAERGDYTLAPRRARTLAGMTVGVVGAGRIGKCVMERLAGFGCELLCHDPRLASSLSLAELMAESDLVTLHAPLTRENFHLIGREALAGVKPGAILINAARGALVDSEALADALESGLLSGAALDVVEGEEGWFYSDRTGIPGAPFERLRRLQNVVLTPHCAYYTERALEDIVENTFKNCEAREEEGERWIV